MIKTEYTAFIVREDENGGYTRGIEKRNVEDLPDGELTVHVAYSSLNYKDALSGTGNRGVTRTFPHQPGIDGVGIVEESNNDAFSPGDTVILGGGDLGMNTAGGFGEYVRIPADWAIHLPKELPEAEAIAIGTAGFTAAMAVEEITERVAPQDGEILVTGATGGVGSYAIAILSQLGYSVCAVTGKESAHPYLRELGAQRIIDRDAATKGADKPILSAEWAGAIDNVGGPILARAIKAAKPNAVVASCGNAASADLPLTVFPFILRGVRLIGIDSPSCPPERRRRLWKNLSDPWYPRGIKKITREISLSELDGAIDTILHGGMRGRVVIRHGWV